MASALLLLGQRRDKVNVEVSDREPPVPWVHCLVVYYSRGALTTLAQGLLLEVLDVSPIHHGRDSSEDRWLLDWLHQDDVDVALELVARPLLLQDAAVSYLTRLADLADGPGHILVSLVGTQSLQVQSLRLAAQLLSLQLGVPLDLLLQLHHLVGLVLRYE